MIANRGEIAKRFFLALHEEKISSVAIVTDVDINQSWYEMADEVIHIGNYMNYNNIDMIIAAALLSKANAIYPGYGFLSENVNFVDRIEEVSKKYKKEIIFMGPSSNVMNKVGNKLEARQLAQQSNVPMFKGSERILDYAEAKKYAKEIGYPIILKLNQGGGGKGMIPVTKQDKLEAAIDSSQRIGKSLYKDETFYIEKLITQPVHVEVQIFNGISVGLRKCAVQRNNQKIVEETGETFLPSELISKLYKSAEKMARASGYSDSCGAGTVEFLWDTSSNEVGFLEMNTRLQVEHPVTDESLGIDLARWQILNFDGREDDIPYEKININKQEQKNHTIECRIYAENPSKGYAPSPGTITELKLPGFKGVRCDFGFHKGDVILPYYDPMIGKVIVYAENRQECITKVERALSELYVGGIHTNIQQLLHIVRHTTFIEGNYTNRLLIDHKELEESFCEDSMILKTAVFGALCNRIQRIQKYVNEYSSIASLDDSMWLSKGMDLSETCSIQIQGREYIVDIIQNAINLYHIFIQKQYVGNFEVFFKLEHENNFLIRSGLQFYNTEIYQMSHSTIIKLRSPDKKVYYSNIIIQTSGQSDTSDPIGLKRAPFQSAFVRLMQEKSTKKYLKKGSKVQKGDPIIVISAMKMETTIHAHMSGSLIHLIEDGDLTKLEIGKTNDGLVIGRSIKENEPLFLIQSSDISEKNPEKEKKKLKSKMINYMTKDHDQIINPFFTQLLKDDKGIQIKNKEDMILSFNIIFAYLKGLYNNKNIVNKLSESIELLSDKESVKFTDDPSIEDSISNMIIFYTNIKKVFSHAIFKEKFSYFDELTVLYRNLKDTNDYGFSEIKPLLDHLFTFYAKDKLKTQFLETSSGFKIIFLFFQRAFYHSSESGFLIKMLINMLGKFSKLSQSTKKILQSTMQEEEKERDDFLFKYIRQTFPNLIYEMQMESSTKYIRDYRKFIKDPFSTIDSNIDQEEALKIKIKLKDSLKSSSNISYDSLKIPKWARKEFMRKINFLQKAYKIKILFSPFKYCYVFELTHQKDITDQRYFCISIIPETIKIKYNKAQDKYEISVIEKACIHLAKCIRLYQKIKPNQNNMGEIYAFQDKLKVDILNNTPGYINYRHMLSIGENIFVYFANINFKGLITYFKVDSTSEDQEESLQSFIFKTQERIIYIDPVDEEYEEYLYCSWLLDPRKKRQYDLDKWPVEKWARQTFQENKFREILLNSIDNFIWKNPKTGQREIKPVGGKIYIGNIQNIPACFYMKDSKVSGGATGNLEGLKYIAACYISFLLKIPLYVWNDGAGANIKEGMISLKRAAQGFMMNAIGDSNITEKTLLQFIKHSADPVLKKLLVEVKSFIESNKEISSLPNGKTFITAIGIGSSTGLDVYGSSQAAIQIMLDSENSYRVLTGANVIESVTGEKMTNYEIGGAKVMGKWTGIVNLIANNKFDVINYVNQVQKIFSSNQIYKKIQRKERPKFLKPQDFEVINENIVRENVDNTLFLPFNDQFYRAGSLFAGFAQVGGYPILIMGPRTRLGVRSYASIVKARELIKISQKTGVNQIFIWGENTYKRSLNDDENTLRARNELSKLLNKKQSQIRICILTNARGIHNMISHFNVDALIYIQEEKIDERLQNIMNQNAHFIVNSYSSAFDLSLKILSYLNDKKGNYLLKNEKIAKNKPKIPEDLSRPYDMIDSVIKQIFDKDSFIEFYRDMNSPFKGPALISGLARVNGTTVGILADQPNILSGAADAIGTEKFRLFTEFLDKHQIPLIMLSNSPGFLPGTKQERLRIQQIGGESLDVNVLSEIPVVSVVLNQNYGGRQIHAFARDLRPGILYITLDDSIMAVMGSEASFNLFHREKYTSLIQKGETKMAKEMKENYVKEYNTKARAKNDAMASGMIDILVPDIKDLQKYIANGLEIVKKNLKMFRED